MMYPFMTLEDNTEIVHSEVFIVEGKEMVKVYIEKPKTLMDNDLTYSYSIGGEHELVH